jgi:hypothetical protein
MDDDIFASYILNVQCERAGSEKQKDGAIKNTVAARAPARCSDDVASTLSRRHSGPS